MTEQDRDGKGKFAAKGSQIRAVRTIRLTDATWETIGDKANEHDMSKADYLEALFSNDIQWETDDFEEEPKSNLDFDVDEVVDLLKEALTFKSNAGGKIKAKIKEVIELVGYDLDE